MTAFNSGSGPTSGPGPTPPVPPLSREVVADWHAGAYPDDVAALLRARIAADPEASDTVAALAATVADLRHLPPIPMPPQVAARLDAVIAAEAAVRAGRRDAGADSGPQAPQTPRPPVPNVTSLPDARAARRGGRPQRRWAIGLGIAAAVAAVFTVGAVVIQPGGNPGHGMAGAAPSPTAGTSAPATAGKGRPPVGAASEPSGAAPTTGMTQAIIAEPHHLDELLPRITGREPVGPLSDPTRLQACLAANGVSGEHVLGVLPVQYTGQQAYAISLRDADGTVRILVVRRSCGASGADLLAEQTTGG